MATTSSATMTPTAIPTSELSVYTSELLEGGGATGGKRWAITKERVERYCTCGKYHIVTLDTSNMGSCA